MQFHSNPSPVNVNRHRNSVVTVGVTDSLLCGASRGRAKVYLATFSTSPVFMGGANVTVNSGFPLVSPDGKTLAVQVFETTGPVHGIVASGSATVYVWEEQ